MSVVLFCLYTVLWKGFRHFKLLCITQYHFYGAQIQYAAWNKIKKHLKEQSLEEQRVLQQMVWSPQSLGAWIMESEWVYIRWQKQWRQAKSSRTLEKYSETLRTVLRLPLKNTLTYRHPLPWIYMQKHCPHQIWVNSLKR